MVPCGFSVFGVVGLQHRECTKVFWENSTFATPLSLGFHRKGAVLILDSKRFDSNWVDCYVNNRIYLLITSQLCSFLASSLHSWKSLEKQEHT